MTPILDPVAFVVNEVHTRNLISGAKCWCNGRHEHLEYGSCDSKIIRVGACCGLEEVRKGTVLGDDNLYEPSEYWIKSHGEEETTGSASMPRASCQSEMASSWPARSTAVVRSFLIFWRKVVEPARRPASYDEHWEKHMQNP